MHLTFCSVQVGCLPTSACAAACGRSGAFALPTARGTLARSRSPRFLLMKFIIVLFPLVVLLIILLLLIMRVVFITTRLVLVHIHGISAALFL